MRPFATAPDCTFYVGDVLAVTASLPSQSVHTIVTSPPYWNLRSYLETGHPDKALELGSEKLHDCLGWAQDAHPNCGECFLCHMRTVARSLWRVLRDDGTLWINIGDSYTSNASTSQMTRAEQGNGSGVFQIPSEDQVQARRAAPNRATAVIRGGLKMKDRVGIPERLALALQADGWVWRDTIHLCKVAPMPESVRDRTTQAHEPLFLFTKKARYFFDNEAVRLPYDPATIERTKYPREDTGSRLEKRKPDAPERDPVTYQSLNPAGRNPRSWMLWNPESNGLQHYAAYPRFIPSFAIRAGTSEHGVCGDCGAPWERVTEQSGYDGVGRADDSVYTGKAYQSPQSAPRGPSRNFGESRSATLGWRPTCTHDAPVIPATVLDPFGGSGTTSLVARQLGRRSIYIDLSEKYAAIAVKRMEEQTPMLPLASIVAASHVQAALREEVQP